MLARTAKSGDPRSRVCFGQLSEYMFALDDHPDMGHEKPAPQAPKELGGKNEEWGSWNASGRLYNDSHGMIVVNPGKKTPVFVTNNTIGLELVTLSGWVSFGAAEFGRPHQLYSDNFPVFGEQRLFSREGTLVLFKGQAFSIAASDTISVWRVVIIDDSYRNNSVQKMFTNPIGDPYGNLQDAAHMIDWIPEE